MHTSFHLTDKCNLRCKDCHWFSSEVEETDSVVSPTDWVSWVAKHPEWGESIRLTGGEPTLYAGFTELVNSLPNWVNVQVCTNGTNLDVLKEIRRRVKLTVSINREITLQFRKDIIALGHITEFNTYVGPLANLRNELEYGRQNRWMVGRSVQCLPRYLRFGSDGYAYVCETGLRTKNAALRAGFSLWEGDPKLEVRPCVCRAECTSNFLAENQIIGPSGRQL